MPLCLCVPSLSLPPLARLCAAMVAGGMPPCPLYHAPLITSRPLCKVQSRCVYVLSSSGWDTGVPPKLPSPNDVARPQNHGIVKPFRSLLRAKLAPLVPPYVTLLTPFYPCYRATHTPFVKMPTYTSGAMLVACTLQWCFPESPLGPNLLRRKNPSLSPIPSIPLFRFPRPSF